MKVGLILANNRWASPYVEIYTKYLDEAHIDYDIILWNRDLSEAENDLTFTCSEQVNKISLYFKYSSFIKQVLRSKKYEKIVVFSSQVAIFLAFTLLSNYRKRFVLDLRDLAFEQIWFLKPLYKMIVKSAGLNVVSSPGFIKYLPKADYLVSHNLNQEEADNAKNIHYQPNAKNKILTIGAIRNHNSNVEVIDAVAGRKDVDLQFVGKGPSSESLMQYVKVKNCDNISFVGYYNKQEEPEYVKKCSFLNIYYPKEKSHSSILSNRFYVSLVYKKPMLVTHGGIQGDYVEKYGLGVFLENCDDLVSKLNSYLSSLEVGKYELNCNKLLECFVTENKMTKQAVVNFLKN